MSYKDKYFKYKNKYFQLKNQKGGNIDLKELKNVIQDTLRKQLHNNENYFLHSDENLYVCWYNQEYKTLCVQNSDNYNGDDQIDLNIRYKNKLNIIVDDQFVFQKCYEGKYQNRIELQNIPERWIDIVNNLIKISTLNLLTINVDITKIKEILNIPDELFNAPEVNIKYYNNLMDYLSKLNIHESINLDSIDLGLFNHISRILNLNFIGSQQKYIEYITNASDKHSATLKDHTFEDVIYKTFDVSTNGAMAVITKSVLNLNETNCINLILHILTLFISQNDNVIASYLNGYTSFIRNYQKVQYANKFRFITKGLNQNFLQWFIMSINPLTFFVPSNSMGPQQNVTEEDILNNMKKCLIFYSCLSLFIKHKKQDTPNYMKKILFKKYNDDIKFNDIIEQIKKEQKLCSLSKFPGSDGFGSNPDEMLKMNFLNEYYGHKFLDPRHLITILLGSQGNPNYRQELRDTIPELLTKLEKLKETDPKKYELYVLQLFSRLKLAQFEPIKLGDCIDRIKLDGMYLLTKTSLNNDLSDDDIKMATYYFNKYTNSEETIRCNSEYFYLNYGDINLNGIDFNVIIKISKTHEMHFILYSDTTEKINLNPSELYYNINQNIDVSKISKSVGEPINKKP